MAGCPSDYVTLSSIPTGIKLRRPRLDAMAPIWATQVHSNECPLPYTSEGFSAPTTASAGSVMHAWAASTRLGTFDRSKAFGLLAACGAGVPFA